MAIDSNNNLWVANYSNNTISVFNSSGVYQGNIETGLSNPADLEFDSNGNLWASNYGNNTVSKFISSLLWTNASDNTVIADPSTITSNTNVCVNTASISNQTVTYSANIPLSTYNLNDTTAGSQTLILSGVISGSGDVIKTGSGNLTLSGTNNYTGSTVVTSGTLSLSGASQSPGFAISSGAIINLNSSSNQTYSGVFLGEGTVTQSGTGTTTLTGANTYTGATNVTAGTLSLSGANASSGFAMSSGTTLNLSASSDQTYSGVISGAGSLNKSGTGTTTLTATNTYTGPTTVTAGTLKISGANASSGFAMSSGTTLDFSSSSNQSYSGVVSGAGGITQSGTGTTTLTGANTYTGATNVTAGTLKISGANASSGFAVSSGATLNLSSSSNQTYSGVVSGAGGITQSGTGTTTLTGANTYTGSTNVNAGTLNVSGSGTISNTVELSPNSNITYDATSTPGSISSLTYNMSDGGAGVSSGPVVTGTITNNASSPLSLPSSINIANDGTIVNGDFIKMPQGTNWTLVSGASSGDSSIAVDPTLTAGGSIVYGLDRTTNNTLKLKVLSNAFTDTNATISTADHSHLLHLMHSIKESSHAETWHVSPVENLREAASKFKSFVSRIRSFSGKQSLETKPSIFAAEPVKLQKGSFGVWFGALFNMGKNKQTDLMAESNDHQEGLVGGVEYRNEKRQNFLGLMLGATMGKSELKNNKDNNSKTKTGMFGIYFTKGIKEFEVEGTISSAFAKSDTERAAFVPTKLIVHGDVNSKTFQERVALGYKFKWKNEKTGTTSTSIKPYIGINAMQFYRGAFKENDGGVFSISRSKMSYKTYGGEFGVGLRKRVDLENAKSLKFTLDLKALHIFNSPKIEDRIYLQGAPVDGIAVQGASLSKTTWAPSFVAQYGSPNWKISLKGTVLIQNNRTSYSGLIRGSYFM